MGCHFLLQSMKMKSESELAQSCPTLRYPMVTPGDRSPPGSSVHGIFQARVLEWVAVGFFSFPQWQHQFTLLAAVYRSSFFSTSQHFFLFKKTFIYIPIWLYPALVAALRIFDLHRSMQTLSWCMWDLFTWPEIEPRVPALGIGVLATRPPGKYS